MVFLIYIVYALRKLSKEPTQISFKDSNQPTFGEKKHKYYKAVKAILILIPLLGLNYWFLLVPPVDSTAKIIFINLRAFLNSFQGLFVAIIYCFRTREVRNAIAPNYKKLIKIFGLGKKNVNRNEVKGSAGSGSTLLNPTTNNENENYTLDSNDARNPLLKSNQQLQDSCNSVRIPIQDDFKNKYLLNPE